MIDVEKLLKAVEANRSANVPMIEVPTEMLADLVGEHARLERLRLQLAHVIEHSEAAGNYAIVDARTLVDLIRRPE